MKASTDLSEPALSTNLGMKNAWLQPGLWITIAAIVLIGLLPVFQGRNAATREVIFTMLMSVVLASNLNIILGYTGYVSFGHVVFFGLGGYLGLFLLSIGQSLWVALLGGAAISGLLAFLLGKAILRLRGAYFALATIGVNEAVRAFVNNFKPFGASTGISLNFAIYKDYGGATNALWLSYYLMVALVIISILLSYAVKNSKFGLSLLAIREDEDAAEVMGVRTPNAKTLAYVFSAIIPGMVGVLFFFKNGNVEPVDAFRLNQSIETIVMIMLGGQGTILGPIIGAIGYQRLRGILLTNPLFSNIQLTVAGVLLLLIILFIPSGVIGWIRRRFPSLRKVLP